MQQLPFVSVVVTTWNRAVALTNCLASLKAQDYPLDRFETLVVDDGSTDGTPEVVCQFQDRNPPEIRYIRQKHTGPNAARNAGIAVAKGDPICFVDDDVEVPPRWLRDLVAGVLRHPEAGAVGGPIRVRFEGKPPRFCGREPLVTEGELDLGAEERAVREVNGGNMALRGWALHEVGVFDESLLIYGDELEWQKRLARAGYPIVYIPSAWLWHCRTGSDLRLANLLRKYLRMGLHHVVFARRTGEEVSMRASLRAIPLYLAHAVRRRCVMGVLLAARQLGVLWGLFKESYR